MFVLCRRFDAPDNRAFSDIFVMDGRQYARFAQATKKMEKELRVQIERLQEDKNYNDQMYKEVCVEVPKGVPGVVKSFAAKYMANIRDPWKNEILPL